MNARRVEVTFSQDEWEHLESSRGRESRASFVKHHYLRALESALGSRPEGGAPDGVQPPPASASSRAPEQFDAINVAQNPDGSLRVRTAREVLNAQRQAKMNRDRKP